MNRNPRFAVVLSGCGRADGSEIHESVCALLGIENTGGEYACFAPDVKQAAVVNHLTGRHVPETRNVLTEAARIARGDIRDLKEFDPAGFDAILFPGGIGAVTNWCTFASDGINCSVNPDVRAAIRKSYDQGLVIGAMCIAPVLLAVVLADKKIRFTLGAESKTTAALEKLGNTHRVCGVTDVCTDEDNRICTTPAYMLASNVSEVYRGAVKLAAEMHRLITL